MALSVSNEPGGAKMVDAEELIEMICQVIATSPTPIPVSFMNHSPQDAMDIISRVVERLAGGPLELDKVHIDPGLAEEAQVSPGYKISKLADTTIEIEMGLGRQVRFVRPEMN